MKALITKARRRLARDLASLNRSARKSVARTLYSCPGVTDRNPRRRIVTLSQYCKRVRDFPDSAEQDGCGWYLPTGSPCAIERQTPVSLNDAAATAFGAAAARLQNGTHCQLPETFLACIHNARLQGRDFLVLSPDRRIFFESALLQQEVLERNGILDSIIWPVPRASHAVGCLMAQESPNAYYHWLIEVLPKLSTIHRFVPLSAVPLIVPPVLKSFQADSLRMAGVNDSRLLPFDNGCWQIGKLFFPSLPGPTGSPSPAAVRWLREQFLPPRAQLAKTGTKRIYLTRRDASQRRVLNESQVIAFLEAEGFSTVCPGELTFAEQIEIFSHAEVVIGPHGAGATNMVFAPEGATLIEFFGENYLNGCFWALANLRKQRYGFVVGPATWLDYEVRVDELRALLRLMNLL